MPGTIGLFLAALALATLSGLAKAGDNSQAPVAATTPPMPFVTDGTMNIHGWVLDENHSDEFSGHKLETRKWVPDMPQWGKNWSWSPRNVSVSNGSLHLVMKYDSNDISGRSKAYTSGIITRRLQGQIFNRWWHTPLILMLSLGLLDPYRTHPSAEGFPARMSVDYVRVWQSTALDAIHPLWPQSRQVLTKQEFINGLTHAHPRRLRYLSPGKRRWKWPP